MNEERLVVLVNKLEELLENLYETKDTMQEDISHIGEAVEEVRRDILLIRKDFHQMKKVHEKILQLLERQARMSVDGKDESTSKWIH